MDHLDPHSVYIPSSELAEANEDLMGNFEGIGVEFNLFNDTVNVIYVIHEGPSEKAGLQLGDKIIKVNDSSIVSTILPIQSIRKMIRGKAGSDVKLTIKRGNGIQDIKVTRGRIPLLAVDVSYMLDAKNGYLRLNKFSQNTYQEFMQGMELLKKNGMQNLIL